jgi:hypothetical protein
MVVRILISFLALMMTACVSDGDEQGNAPEKVVRKPVKLGTKVPETPQPKQGESPEVLKMETPVETCKEAKSSRGQLPIWLADRGIIITRVLKECVTLEGREGFEEDSPWMAMGIPCTGDGGKIDIKGEHYDPKLVSLILSTDCAMHPSDLQAVKAAGMAGLGFSAAAKLLAYNPLAIQYWEIPGIGDADVGFTIDLRTTEALQRVWKTFSEQSVIPVRLYGRENAWVMGDQFFFVQAELVKTSTSTFRMDVKDVKALKPEEIARVKASCEALRPSRNCFKVFK